MVIPPDYCNPMLSSLRKIGVVLNPQIEDIEKRMTQLGTGNPFKVECEHSVPCDEPRVMEKYWHSVHQEHRVRNEWFNLSDEKKVREMLSVTTDFHHTGVFHGDLQLFEEIRNRNAAASEAYRKGLVDFHHDELDTSSTETNDGKTASLDKTFFQTILFRHKEKLMEKGHATRSYLDSSEFQIIRDLLDRHPDAKMKIGVGVKAIFVQKAFVGQWQSFCFHVKRTDGSEEDFSYNACLGLHKSDKSNYTWKK